MVAVGEHPRHALALGVALFENCLRQRALARTSADDVQLVFGKEVRRCEQVGDELGDCVDRRSTRKPSAGRGLALRLTGGAQLETIQVHIPRMRYRLEWPKP